MTSTSVNGRSVTSNRPRRDWASPSSPNRSLPERLFLSRIFRNLPWLCVVDKLVHLVCQRHDHPKRVAELPLVVSGLDLNRVPLQIFNRNVRRPCRQLAVELLKEPRAAARNVYVLANEIAIYPRHEIIGIEVEVLDAPEFPDRLLVLPVDRPRRQLGRHVSPSERRSRR